MLPLQQTISGQVQEYLVELVPQVIDFAIALGIFLATLVVVYYGGKAVAVPIARRALKARNVEPTLRKPALKAVGVAMLIVALAVAMAVANFGNLLTAAATVVAALTLAIGFAAQDVLGNLVAGVFMISDPKVEIGDWVEWDDNAGVIEDISFRVTRVQTFDNELITVPNSELVNTALTNPVANDKLRIQSLFGIGYDDDIGEAREVIIEEAERHPDILANPGPSVRLTELGDSAVGLKSRVWIADPARSDFVRVRSEYVEAVKERFDEEGIDMPYPHTELTGGIDIETSEPQEAQIPTDD